MSCKVFKSTSNFENRLVTIFIGDISLYLACQTFQDPQILILLAIKATSKYMSENELTCVCIDHCYCLETEGDQDDDYPNTTIDCDCGSSLDCLAIPTCNCDIHQFNTFFDCIEEPDVIICTLWHLDLHLLLPQYLYMRILVYDQLLPQS
jgi:hypothetical protein